jgi:endonuclease YncB( thermonuclease family)
MAAMRRAIAVIAIVVAIAGQVLAGDPVMWRVVNVHDGDTLTALDDTNTQYRIRLQGIDAPELGQPFGRVSRDRLAALAKGKAATITPHGRDRYGRTIATIEIEHDELGHRLVAEGLAWHYSRYSDDATLDTAQRAARDARRGLWADEAPTPPWEWRATEKQRRAVPSP